VDFSEKTIKAMSEFGLTGYEIKVYLTLLEFGPRTASEISENSTVPYSKIYDVLNNLETKGWIEIQQSRPNKFYPKSPSSALEIINLESEMKRRRGEKQIIDELQPTYDKKGVRERPDIWIVKGQHNILNKTKETIENCEEELLIAIPSALSKITSLFLSTLKNLKDKGVKIKILITQENSKHNLKIFKDFDTRVRNNMYAGGLISDSKQVILLLNEETETDSGAAIWAEHTGLTLRSKNYFNYLWNDSQ
jgi:sugar-specific transcriptional regulator TrmB